MHQSNRAMQQVLLRVSRDVIVIAVLAKLYQWALGRSFTWVFMMLGSMLVGRIIACTVAAIVVSYQAECRPLHLLWRDLALRGPLRAREAGALFLIPFFIVSTTASDLLIGLAVGATLGLTDLLSRPTLTAAERHYGRAFLCLRKGDQEGARREARAYIEHAKDDPERKLRRPAAEAFLRGETDTLEVMATELEAASAPAGRGTEVLAAERPEGTGTEMESADASLVSGDGASLDREHSGSPRGHAENTR